MPCSYEPSAAEIAESRAATKARWDELTALLCLATEILEQENLIHMHPPLAAWKKKHDKQDARRIAAEQREAEHERVANEVVGKIEAALSDVDPVLRDRIKRKLNG